MKTHLIAFLLLLTFPIVAQDFDKVQIRTIKISDNIYMLQGQGGNIGVNVGDDGVMIIDDQFAPLAGKIKAAISEISDKEVNYVVNTHHHGDHMGGNEVFGADGSIIIAQDNVRTKLSGGDTPKVAWPVITFSDDMTYYFNDEEIYIHHGPSAHTDGDAVVYFKTSNIIHMGDTFVTYGYPYIDIGGGGSVIGMIAHIGQVLDLIDENTTVIPGHGDLCKKSDMIIFRNILIDIVDRVKTEMESGKNLDEIQSSGIISRYDQRMNGGFIKSPDFIGFVYEDLAK
ncbi:MAG: MBL fold metallo-hydrolase [Bacteroidetes bacterium]|nr:MBL fold metallo-hydrolase [Bacteroidota bacterium]MDA1121038.1 MBL fold metallo-hydrolase [Bacteroidota bacterium]